MVNIDWQACVEKEFVSFNILRDSLFDICFWFVGSLIFCFISYMCMGSACVGAFWPIESLRGLIGLIGLPLVIVLTPLIVLKFLHACAVWLAYIKALLFRQPYVVYHINGIFHVTTLGFQFTPWAALLDVSESHRPPIIGLKRRRLVFRKKHPKYFLSRELLIDAKDASTKEYLLHSARKMLG